MATGRKTAYREFDHPAGVVRAPFGKQNGYREVNVEQRRRSTSPQQPIPKTAYRDVAAASPRPPVGQQQQQRGYRDVEPKFAAGQQQMPPNGGGVPQSGYRDVGAKSPSTPKTPLGYRDVPPATPRKSQEAMGSEPVMITADSITGTKVVRERLDWQGGCSVVKKAATKSAGPRSGKTPKSSTLLVNKSVIGGSDDSGGGEYANVINPVDGTLAMPSTATVAPTASLLDLPHLGPSSPKDKYNQSKKNNRSRNRHESPTVIDYARGRTKRRSRASRHSNNNNKNGTPATRRNRRHEKRTGANGRGNGGCLKRYKCILCILITVIGVSALIATAIGLGLYFGAAKKDEVGKYTGRIDSLYESFCGAKFHEDEEYDDECGLGLAPTSSTCETGGHCFRYNYESQVVDDPHNSINGTHFHRMWTIVNHSAAIKIEVQKSNTHFCRLQHEGKSQLGVCDKEKGCDRIYAGGQDEPSWYEEPRWEDTCDQPSPCWHIGVESHVPWQMADVKQDYAPPVANRSECIRVAALSDRNVNDRCPNSISALAMLQHRRCVPGKNRTAKAPCPGLPVFLRVCHTCPPPSKAYKGDEGCVPFALDDEGCTFTCSGAMKTPMPTGTKCISNGNKSMEAYCFMGVCLEAHKYDSKSACGKGKKNDNERRRKK